METPFFGGSYASLSTNLAADRCMNLYTEVVESKTGKQVGGFYSTPGQRFLLTLANQGEGAIDGPMRGLSAKLKTYMIAVYGNQVVKLDINYNVTLLGLLKTSTGPVSIVDNGHQITVVDGYQMWVYADGTWTQITTMTSPVFATEQDGFALANQYGTNEFFQSNLNDMTTWDGLNFSSADSEPSAIYSLISLFRQIWIFKKNSIEVWNNAGLNGFAFQRMQGVFLQVGCIAPFSVAIAGDHVMWLGQNEQGSVSVFINNGYSEDRKSTHPIDYQILGYIQATQQGVQDAIAFAYNQAGHLFYVLTFPSGNATWVFDLATNLWHERGEFANGVYNRWDPSCYAFFNNQHIVGSSSGQQLSVLDLTYGTDDLPVEQTVNPKRWMRRWRGLQKPVNAPVSFGSLRLDMQTGIATRLNQP